jgi:UDP-N-acetylmuramate: L-alanyl-gamma-D-glutamyl-meso-diaminopimelate ligase
MKIHILGICGTFMGGVAVLAKQMGHEVRGCDAQVYPPMSTQLEEQGITLIEGFGADQLDYQPDLIIVGNVMKRGMPVVERMLNDNMPYISGPQWIAEYVLPGRCSVSIAGTHGKTTTSSMVAWILEFAGLKPGFLIGGVPENFGVSSRLGEGNCFVLEADEYDSAFFDKRSKFIHYHPRALIINNVEFDHADIFEDLEAIKKQFHYLVRTVPEKGLIVAPKADKHVADVIAKGCWTPIEYIGEDWQAKVLKADGSEAEVFYQSKSVGVLKWNLLGMHNIHNALSALAATHYLGVEPSKALVALAKFKNVKRRLESLGEVQGITLYDDFAHHPTAIATTLGGLRAKVGKKNIIAIAELGSYTMRSGVHNETLVPAFGDANEVWLYVPKDSSWDLESYVHVPHIRVRRDIDLIIDEVTNLARPDDQIVIMSNRGFGGLAEKLKLRLRAASIH